MSYEDIEMANRNEIFGYEEKEFIRRQLINREQEQRLINETFLLTEEKQLKAIHAADILSIKNLVRECDEYKILLSQAQESINYWMKVADEARVEIAASGCDSGRGRN